MITGDCSQTRSRNCRYFGMITGDYRLHSFSFLAQRLVELADRTWSRVINHPVIMLKAKTVPQVPDSFTESWSSTTRIGRIKHHGEAFEKRSSWAGLSLSDNTIRGLCNPSVILRQSFGNPSVILRSERSPKNVLEGQRCPAFQLKFDPAQLLKFDPPLELKFDPPLQLKFDSPGWAKLKSFKNWNLII